MTVVNTPKQSLQVVNHFAVLVDLKNQVAKVTLFYLALRKLKFLFVKFVLDMLDVLIHS